MVTLNSLDTLNGATCCTVVDDSFSTDTVDQYSFWGLNGGDELSVSGGKLLIPDGGRLRRNSCPDRAKGIRIQVSTVALDRSHSLAIFFWCSQDLSAGYQVRIHDNTGAGELSRRGCLVELCLANGSVLKSRYDGANPTINTVEAWADQESGNAYVTVNSSFSWILPAGSFGTSYAAAITQPGYFGIGCPSLGLDLEVESYTAAVVGSTGDNQGCIVGCSITEPINACTHTEPCNGGTLDEDFYTSSDLTPNVGGWFVSDAALIPTATESPSTLWSEVAENAINFTKPAQWSCGGNEETYTDNGYARRFLVVSGCSQTVTLRISMAKNANLSLYASILLVPVCGSSYTDSLNATWGAAATYELGDCSSDDSDSIESVHQNVPVGIYRVECACSNNVLGNGGIGAITGHPACVVDFEIEGASGYLKICP